jgi:hypothetical protein
MGLENASLGYEFADIAATIAGETVSGSATPRKLAVGRRPHLSEPNWARR